MKYCYAILLALWTLSLKAQDHAPFNGVSDKRPSTVAFTNATICVDPQTVYTQATLLIQDGLVSKVGPTVRIQIPAGAKVIDLHGRYIYPSFIDPYTHYGLPKPEKGRPSGPQLLSDKPGAWHWNEAIHPEVAAAALFKPDPKKAKQWREAGFGLVSTHVPNGIARGTAALVSLGAGSEQDLLLKPQSATHYSFNKGNSSQNYPSSLMGSIALLRQTYYDAQWYQQQSTLSSSDLSIEAWNTQQELPQIFEVEDWLTALRADKVGDEMSVQYLIKGAGDEYQRIPALKETGASFIVPLNFPKAYEITSAWEGQQISYQDLKHWEMAPANAHYMAEVGIDFCFTAKGLDNLRNYLDQVRKAIAYGLDTVTALSAMTERPARFLNVQQQVGKLRPGYLANFIITSGSIFRQECTFHENWVVGKPYPIHTTQTMEWRGDYQFHFMGRDSIVMEVRGRPNHPNLNLNIDDYFSANIAVDEQTLAISFRLNDAWVRLNGWIAQVDSSTFPYQVTRIKGSGLDRDGKMVRWEAHLDEPYQGSPRIPSPIDTIPTDFTIPYPFAAYGRTKLPVQRACIITNATVWTNEKDGILYHTDVALNQGKIVAIGKGLTAEKVFPKTKQVVQRIDGTGKHLTCGIVDEHSHIAISRGVNENGQSISAEVSIGDVINSEDVNIFRQLSGGVTTSQLLHGSANPIGGQSGIIKLRWGQTPEQMKFAKASPFIKFALGENVKQTNWGDKFNQRFPQTRMGVEQLIMDAFTRAKAYEAAWDAYRQSKSKTKAAPRKDLELEVLLQILKDERFITCHSYVQSEINMLMNLADSMGFRINTFTHVLEGYKIADKLKAHGAAASTFSDWWAYKFEVQDAIPYNAALLTRAGVLTGINSDDAEMGRRLNQEAAKSMKYGGLSEEEAWKLVTLNPAKMLHIDQYVGSIKVGKDADVVLWSHHPLSIEAKAEKTFIDGICYYDYTQATHQQQELMAERARIIGNMIDAIEDGAPTQGSFSKPQPEYHCEDL